MTGAFTAILTVSHLIPIYPRALPAADAAAPTKATGFLSQISHTRQGTQGQVLGA